MEREESQARSRWQQKALAQNQPGLLVRTRGYAGPPIWCFRGLDADRRAMGAWEQLFSLRDWMPLRTLLVALPNPDLSHALVNGALHYGLRAVAVSALDLVEVIDDIPAAYLITSPLAALRLFLRGRLSGVRELWLTGDVTGQGALQQRLGEYLPDLVVRDVYEVAEHPGPLAMSCNLGRWHWLNPGMPVSFKPLTETLFSVEMTWNGERYALGDAVSDVRSDCPCGQAGPVTRPAWGRVNEIGTLDHGFLSASHLAQAWFRTEGLADRLRAALIFDPVEKRDQLQVEAAVLEGYDVERTFSRFRELLERELGIEVDVKVREARRLLPSLTVELVDSRGEPG